MSVTRYGALAGRTFIEGIWEIKWLRGIMPYCRLSSFLYLIRIGAHGGITAGILARSDRNVAQLWGNFQ